MTWHSIYNVGTRLHLHCDDLDPPTRPQHPIDASAAATTTTASSTPAGSSSDLSRVEDLHPLQQHRFNSSGRLRLHCSSSSTPSFSQQLQRPPAAKRLRSLPSNATGNRPEVSYTTPTRPLAVNTSISADSPRPHPQLHP